MYQYSLIATNAVLMLDVNGRGNWVCSMWVLCIVFCKSYTILNKNPKNFIFEEMAGVGDVHRGICSSPVERKKVCQINVYCYKYLYRCRLILEGNEVKTSF